MHLEYVKQPLAEKALDAIIAVCALRDGPEKYALIAQLAVALNLISKPPMIARE